MKKLVHWPSLLGFIGVSASAGAALNYFAGLNFWWSALIAAAALLVNGIVATVEDEQPGGFNHPKAESSSDVEN